MSMITIKITTSTNSKIGKLLNKEVLDLLELLLAPLHLGDHFLDIFVIELPAILARNKRVDNTSWICLLRGFSTPSHGLVLATNKFNFPLVGFDNILRLLVTIVKGALIYDHDDQY